MKPLLFAVIVSAITSYVINEGVFKMLLTTLLVMIVTYFEKRFLTFGIVIILLIGLSRVHNGIHYPSDVLIGTILGILYALVGLLLMKKLRLEKNHWWGKFF